MVLRTMSAGEFQANCLAVLDELAKRGDEVAITRQGKVIARVVPPRPLLSPAELLGTAHYDNEEDLVGPTGERWPGE